MNKKRKSRRYITLIAVLSLSLFVCSLAFIVVCGLLKDNGYGDFWWPFVGLAGCLLCIIAAIILFSGIFKDSVSYEKEDRGRKYDAMDLFEISDASEFRIKETLISHGFKENKDGFFTKKVFSLIYEGIYYYAKCVESLDVKNTIEQVFCLTDGINENSKKTCLLLFIYKANMDEKDLSEIKQISKGLIINGTIPVQSCCTSVITLVDAATNRGHFLDLDNKMNISIYAYGCRLIKKYFKK